MSPYFDWSCPKMGGTPKFLQVIKPWLSKPMVLGIPHWKTPFRMPARPGRVFPAHGRRKGRRPAGCSSSTPPSCGEFLAVTTAPWGGAVRWLRIGWDIGDLLDVDMGCVLILYFIDLYCRPPTNATEPVWYGWDMGKKPSYNYYI